MTAIRIFIFLNRFGQPQHQSTLNSAIRRIVRDCNDAEFLIDNHPPYFYHQNGGSRSQRESDSGCTRTYGHTDDDEHLRGRHEGTEEERV